MGAARWAFGTLILVTGVLFTWRLMKSSPSSSGALAPDVDVVFRGAEVRSPIKNVKPPVKEEVAVPVVPFYVYSGEKFSIFELCNWRESERLHSHKGELYFLQDVMEHPWRVENPDDALVYVFPVPFSALTRGLCEDVTLEHIQDMVGEIRRSPHYQRFWGKDHMMVATDWKAVHAGGPKVMELMSVTTNFTFAHKGTFDNHGRWGCTVAAPFTIAGTGQQAEQVFEAAEYRAARPYNLFFQGQTYPNRGYHIRRQAFKYLSDTMKPSVLISTGRKNPNLEQCPREKLKQLDDTSMVLPDGVTDCSDSWAGESFQTRMRRSKYNLFMRGDDPGSARLYDGIAQRTVNLIFSDGLANYLTPFECLVDWENLAFWGSEKLFTDDPVAGVENVMAQVNDESLELRLRKMDDHIADLVWSHPRSRVTQNIIYSIAHLCLPDELLAARGWSRKDLPCKFTDNSITYV